MRIGVFDSGIGGRAIAQALAAAYPNAVFTVISDREHAPYGNRRPDEIRNLTESALKPLIGSKNDVIVIACNTATAYAIEDLRASYPHERFIGIEPMTKTGASLTKTGVIAVCATPATLSSPRYRRLKKRFAAGLKVLEPDCATWAQMIEDDAINEAKVKSTIDEVLNAKADVIVLGCTHYHWIKDLIVKLTARRARVIEPSEAIAARVAHVLKTNGSRAR